MKLTVIIPCFNEYSTLKTIIEAVKISPIQEKEIIVVDDCSNDGSKELLTEGLGNLVDIVIYHNRNLGKGAAIRNAIKRASGDIIVIQDADLEYNPEYYPDLIQPIINNTADVVYGSRFGKNSNNQRGYLSHYIANKLLTYLSNTFSDLDLSDIMTCHKAFKRDIIQSINIEENRFGVDAEITAKLASKKCRIKEINISYSPRTRQEGKKIAWTDGLSSLKSIIKYSF